VAAKQLIWGGYTSDGVVSLYIDGSGYEYRVDTALIPKMEYRFTKDPFGVLNTLKATCLWWVDPEGNYHEKANCNNED